MNSTHSHHLGFTQRLKVGLAVLRIVTGLVLCMHWEKVLSVGFGVHRA